ncbi:hypothetical protein HYALB_00013117 [Hymenoscyphus albidus]|uniref:Uncharacterized protein n=1 Tax=Hymenoscyphus albidus TaxID=595503 RepID=A0A9N9LZU9_9HELO|nr:hypothetical protein HYALB_00013117 [Hymenoscyphus albidus]
MSDAVLPSIEARSPSSKPRRRMGKITKSVMFITYEDLLSDDEKRRREKQKGKGKMKDGVEKTRENNKLRKRRPTPFHPPSPRQAQMASLYIQTTSEERTASHYEDTRTSGHALDITQSSRRKESPFSSTSDREDETRDSSLECEETPRRGRRFQGTAADYWLLVSPSPLPPEALDEDPNTWQPRTSPLLSPTRLPSPSPLSSRSSSVNSAATPVPIQLVPAQIEMHSPAAPGILAPLPPYSNLIRRYERESGEPSEMGSMAFQHMWDSHMTPPPPYEYENQYLSLQESQTPVSSGYDGDVSEEIAP